MQRGQGPAANSAGRSYMLLLALETASRAGAWKSCRGWVVPGHELNSAVTSEAVPIKVTVCSVQLFAVRRAAAAVVGFDQPFAHLGDRGVRGELGAEQLCRAAHSEQPSSPLRPGCLAAFLALRLALRDSFFSSSFATRSSSSACHQQMSYHRPATYRSQS